MAVTYFYIWFGVQFFFISDLAAICWFGSHFVFVFQFGDHFYIIWRLFFLSVWAATYFFKSDLAVIFLSELAAVFYLICGHFVFCYLILRPFFSWFGGHFFIWFGSHLAFASHSSVPPRCIMHNVCKCCTGSNTPIYLEGVVQVL